MTHVSVDWHTPKSVLLKLTCRSQNVIPILQLIIRTPKHICLKESLKLLLKCYLLALNDCVYCPKLVVVIGDMVMNMLAAGSCIGASAVLKVNMSRIMTKPTKCRVRPAKTQIRLGIPIRVFAVRLKKAWVLS